MQRWTETILIAEDESAVRELSGRILTGCGYRVLLAAHAGEAFAMSHRDTGPIDLLVTDVVMPGLGGRELAQQLVESHPNLKVLYMSGYTDNAIIHHGRLDPGVAFLQKPFLPSDLAREVRQVLDASDKTL